MRLQLALLAGAVVGCQAMPGESTIAQDAVVFSPSSFDFGMQPIGTTSAVHKITINPGPLNNNDTILAVTASCPDFVITATGLPATVVRVCELVTCTGQTCPAPNAPNLTCRTTQLRSYTFDTAFQPTVAGDVSCVVTVRETDNVAGTTNNRTLTLTGTGQPPPINIDVSPRGIAFGDVRRNTDSTRAPVTVNSTGSSALSVSSVTISAGFAIRSGPTGAYQLGSNASQLYQVVCHPTGLGAMTGQLTIASNDPDSPSAVVPLTCKGIDSNLDITPSPAALPSTRVGEPIDGTITLRNTGTADMTLEGVTLTGSGITMVTSPPAGKVLSPTGAADVDVHFEANVQGDVSATLVATYDGGQTRTAQISGRALATSMALTPDGEVEFGPVCIGQKKVRDFTLIANDQGGFALSSISDPGPPFTVAAPALPLGLKGAGATQVRFSVSAGPTEPGPASAQLVVRTDIPGRRDHPVQLGVLGLPAGATATPDALDLGSNPVNATTFGQPVHLSNCGGSSILFSNARIEGGDALDFAIVQQPTSSTIPAGGLASWLIVLQAHSVGIKQSKFTVDYDGGTASVKLQGEGLGDFDKEPGRGSYYACSAAAPSALWPIGLAMAALLRRRRTGRAAR